MTAFARAGGRLPALVVAAVVAATGAMALAIARASGIAGRGAGLAAATIGAVTTALSLSAWYHVAARGLSGRRAAKLAVLAGVLASLTAIVGGSIQDGTFDVGEFGRAFLNAEIIVDAVPVLLGGVWNTVRLAVAAEAVSLMLGVTLASMAISSSRTGRAAATVYVDIVRGTPIVVLTLLIYGGLPFLGVVPQQFAAAVAILGINSAAYSAEIFRAGIQSVPRGQLEAARSLGMPYAQAMSSIVLPQAARNVLPPLVSDFIALIKDTAIVLVLIGFTFASADIFSRARGISSTTFSPTPLLLAALFYLALTVPLARLVGALERRVRAGYR